MHIFHEVGTEPHSQYDTEFVLFCYFRKCIHAKKCGIGSYTSKSFCNDREVLFYCLRGDIFFVFIEGVFISIGVIAHTVEFFRRRSYCMGAIDISPPSYIDTEKTEEKSGLDSFFSQHRDLNSILKYANYRNF